MCSTVCWVGGRPHFTPSARLPLLLAEQEFLDTVSVVLEVPQEISHGFPPASDDRAKPLPLLCFTADTTSERSRSEELRGPRSRRTSRDSASSLESSFRGEGFARKDDALAFDRAAEYALCRERLVGWLFRPLLSDAFAMASLTQALSLLGLGGKGQAIVLIRDMAEWFLALPVVCAADITVGREAQNCPVLRWLKGVILLVASSSVSSSEDSAPYARSWRGGTDDGAGDGALGDGKSAVQSQGVRDGKDHRMKDLFGEPVEGDDVGAVGEDDDGGDSEESSSVAGSEGGRGEEGEGDGGGDGDDVCADPEEILRPMYEACVASQRLENASMLSVVAAEALAACKERLEESSLGQVAIGGGDAWVALARKIRVCLFVDHRLHWGVQAERR